MNVSLTPELEQLVTEKVASGMYNSASEVVREALRLLKERDEIRQSRLEELRREIANRRRSVATALMNRLHVDAAESGAGQSVVMASPMGVPLYTKLGYAVVAFIQKFVPEDWSPNS